MLYLRTYTKCNFCRIYFGIRDGTASTKSQIVHAPLRVKHDSAGKPDWIFFARFESIYGRAKIFKQKISFVAIYSIF